MGTIAPSSAYASAAKNDASPARTNAKMIAGPASLTPGPIVVKMPPPIIVPSPTAMRSRARSARRSGELFLASTERVESDVVANKR